MEQRIIYQHHLTLIYLISIPNPNTDDIPNANTNASQNPDHLFASKKPQFHHFIAILKKNMLSLLDHFIDQANDHQGFEPDHRDRQCCSLLHTPQFLRSFGLY